MTMVLSMGCAGVETETAQQTEQQSEAIENEQIEQVEIDKTEDIKEKADKKKANILKNLESHDLVKYGLIPEIVGRIPMIVTLDPLDEAAFVRILTEPKNSLVKQYQKLFDMDGIKLTFKKDALETIAKKAVENNTGARGLRSIMESLMLEYMYSLPSNEKAKELVITKASVEKTRKALIK